MSSKVSAMKLRNTPLPASWVMNATLGPPVALGCWVRRSPMPMTRGNNATTARSAWFRRRPKISRSSDRKNRSHARTGASRTWPAAAAPPAQPAPVRAGPVSDPGAGDPATNGLAIDLEPLSGESHEQVLKAGGDHAEPPHPDPRPDEFRADPLRLIACELTRHLVPGHLRVGEAKPFE